MEEIDKWFIGFPVAEIFPPMSDKNSQALSIYVMEYSAKHCVASSMAREQASWMGEQQSPADPPMSCADKFLQQEARPQGARQAAEFVPARRENAKAPRNCLEA